MITISTMPPTKVMDLAQDGDGNISQRTLNHGHVVAHPGDQLADPTVVEKAQGQAQQLPVQRQPQIDHDALTDEGKPVGVEIDKNALDDKNHQQADGNPAQQLGIAGAKHRIHQQADRPGQRQHQEAADHGADRAHGQLFPVR